MKTHNLFTTMMLFVAGLVLAISQASATPSVDTLNVQGYMKKANGTAVSDGTYTMAIGVFQNGTAIWAKQYAVTVTNGLFSQSLTGSGGDLSAAVPAGTGMRSSFLAATLNPALLSGATSGSVMIRVYASTAIDGANPQFDISLGSTPTAYVAALAQGVEAGSVTLTGIAAASKSNVGGGTHAGKIALLDAGGLLDLTMIPSLPASQISTGQVGVGNGGTGTSDGSVTGTGSVTYQSAAGSTTTIGNSSTTSNVVLQSGTGGIAGTVTGTTGNISFTAGSTSGAINITPGTTSGTVTIGSASSSGASTFGNAGGASSTTIQSGTGHILLSPSGSGVVRVTNGNGLNLVNGTGSITVNAPTNPTSYTFQLPSSAGTSGYVLQTDGAGATSWADIGASLATLNPTGTLDLGGAATTAVNVTPSGTNAAVSIASAGTGTLTVGGAGTGASVFGNNGAASGTTVRSGAGADVTLAAGTGGYVSLSNANGMKLVNGTGNIAISAPLNPTSWSMVLPSSAGSGNQFLMTDGLGTTSWASPYASPGAIGSTTPAAGTFTTLNATTMTTVGMPNNSTGTANNNIAILTATGLQTAATSTTTNIVGIVASGGGTSGTAQVVTSGIVNCQFDATTPTAGHYAAVSTTTAGACMDVGTSASAAGTIIGMITTTGAAASLSPVLVGQVGTLPIKQISVQTKTASGTYTPTAGTQYVIMEGVAPGGGGGGATNVAGNAAAGGGSGSYFKILCPVTQFTGAGVVTIGAVGTAGTTAGANGGAGGTVTVTLAGATTVTANGGSGGTGATTASQCRAPGAGGAISTNTNANCTNLLLVPGHPGQASGSSTTAALSHAGVGAPSMMGPGGSAPAGATGAGSTPTGYGGGGGGAQGATANAGGAGAPGVVIFTEFRAF